MRQHIPDQNGLVFIKDLGHETVAVAQDIENRVHPFSHPNAIGMRVSRLDKSIGIPFARWLPPLNQPPLSNLVILVGRDHPVQNRRPQFRSRRAMRGIVDQVAFFLWIVFQVV